MAKKDNNCKKCGKKLTFLNTPRRRNDICNDCFEEKHKRYCKECGEDLKAFHLTAYGKYLCPGCGFENESQTGKND
jgi:primosomal protein N'